VFTTGKDGTVTIPKMKPGSYQFSETEAPTGYSINKTAQSFAISETGVVSGSTTISNEKIKPSVTPTPVATPTSTPIPTPTPIILMPPATGDRSSGLLIGVGMFAAAACAGGVYLYRRRRKGAA
ncbi:MAG: prealbumin-like fold domain-containing protein, partial [Eubacteriales bacterium]|nr:prealbumin-like fold domain-containing protein [Eubacteriales bacterium]